MNTPVKHSLKLNKVSRSSGSSYKKANSFTDKMMRVIYMFLIMAIDFILFVYSINGKLMENGELNPAMMYIFAGMLAISFTLIFALFFSKDLQNIVCALLTLIMVIAFYNQFALFNVDNFIETWLEKHMSWLSFITIVPSSWLVGLFCAVIIFFAFRFSITLYFITIVLLLSSVVGVKNIETADVDKKEYYNLKDVAKTGKGGMDHSVIYFMIPELPSYHFLSNLNNSDFRELRDLMIGFYANNDFEIFPNAFVEKDDAMSNIVDIYNQVDYTSTSSANRGYAEIIHDWNFRHGTLDLYGLEFNELYDALKKDNGYNISTYSAPEFNLCYKKDDLYSDRCVVKNYKVVSLYDKNSTLEKNIYALLGEWVLSLKNRDLKLVAKNLIDMSNLKNMKVLSENRRVSIEGSKKIFDIVSRDYMKDNIGSVYMVYVDLPSDIYIYDEYCNLKPRKEWVALKDNSLYSGGIDNKRKAYVEQAKCLIGKLQSFIIDIKSDKKFDKTDIIVQGVSNIKELSDMQAGRYSNFVKDKLVNLAIRKGKLPKFLINANICLASDFTKSILRYQDYCYTIDNMKMSSEEMFSLKQNLINNSVIRGSKISNIAINYREWYADFKNKNEELILKQRLNKSVDEDINLEIETMRKAPETVKIDDSSAVYYDLKAFNPDNIFTPADELLPEIEEPVEIAEPIETKAENVEISNEDKQLDEKIEKVENVVKPKNETSEKGVKDVDAPAVDLDEFVPAEFSEDSQIDF